MKEFIIEMENGGVMEGELYEDIAQIGRASCRERV